MSKASPGGVVLGLAQELVAPDPRHLHELRVPARHQQRDEREVRPPGGKQGREEVPLEVVDAQCRHAQRCGERMRERGADQQRPGESRSLGVSDRLQFLDPPARAPEQGPGERHQAAHMVARGELRHHSAVGLVHVHLRVHGMGEQPPRRGVIQRHPGLVAGGLDAEDQHRAILIQFAPFTNPGTSMPIVRVKENEPFEVAMRRFKRTVEKTGLLTELRAREYYEKPTSERKRKLAAAVKRHHKRLRSQMLPAKLY